MKNYYLILGVTSDATLSQIKDAYRRQAKALHPDYYEGDGRPFLDLQEAYAVLSDPKRRRAYDSKISRSKSKQKNAPSWPHAESKASSKRPSYTSFFSSFHRQARQVRQDLGPSRSGQGQLRGLEVEVAISGAEARQGGAFRLPVPMRRRCASCRGRGGVRFRPCRHCRGRGVVVEEYPVTVTFPGGIPDNHVARVSLQQLGLNDYFLVVRFHVRED